ncbi:LuxR family transcriptional regulator [Stutzerimonas nitrititolerans]|uniref:LuxR family transcriptional regulator n=1 Tax=Stutzerimonas nitrititolerans TaxID=2482751 RepID=UPI0035E3CFEF
MGWREDILEQTQLCCCIRSVRELITHYCDVWEFDFCAYGQMLPGINQKIIMRCNNYPHEWNNTYDENGYIDIDPTVSYAQQSSSSVIWPASLESLFDMEKEFWAAAWEFGIRYGAGFPVHCRDTGISMLSFSKRCENVPEQHFERYETRIRWLAESLSCANVLAQLPEATLPKLTSREREVLTWTAVGKSACDVAAILNITERTANFHLSNVMYKLDSVNKTQAAVKAVRLSLIRL